MCERASMTANNNNNNTATTQFSIARIEVKRARLPYGLFENYVHSNVYARS